jgi:probable HAF family extracellular repeat protein
MTIVRWGLMVRFVFVSIPVLCSAQSYTVTDLGTLGGSESIATAINASGEITGGATNASGSYHAFLYKNGSMTDLGTLGGPSSQGQSINQSGEIAGYAQLPPGPTAGWPPRRVSFYSAFTDSKGTMTALGSPGGEAYAINDSGQIAGQDGGAYFYSGGTFTNLGNLGGGTTQVEGINDTGEVVGYSYLADGDFRGFYWIHGTMTALGTLGGDWSQAYAINNSGQITGTAYTSVT